MQQKRNKMSAEKNTKNQKGRLMTDLSLKFKTKA